VAEAGVRPIPAATLPIPESEDHDMSRNVASERHALQELQTARTALTFNQRGSHATDDWLTDDETDALARARAALDSAIKRVARNYNRDDPPTD
jgi:hypothetical protein